MANGEWRMANGEWRMADGFALACQGWNERRALDDEIGALFRTGMRGRYPVEAECRAAYGGRRGLGAKWGAFFPPG